MGFLKVIVLPLYETLNEFFKNDETMSRLKGHIEKNIKCWEQIHCNVKQAKSKSEA